MKNNNIDPIEKLKLLRTDINDTTKTISLLVRFVSLVLVSTPYGILISKSQNNIFSYLAKNHNDYIVFIILFGILSLFIDYLQYIFKYFAIKEALKNENTYNYNSILYKAANWCFFSKQIIAGIGILTLIGLLGFSIIKNLVC